MKTVIPILSIAFLFAACNTDKQQTEIRTIQSAQQPAAIDTAGLAQFQQWKAQNELAAATPVQQEQEVTAEAPVKTVTVIREVRVQQAASARRTVKQTKRPVKQSPAPTEAETSDNTSTGGSDIATNTGSGTGTADAPAQQETAKSGGMSNAKKGAVIGSAGGAVIGAVINKRNRAVGAVIGGVLGGAAGYGIGKKKDGKEGQQ